MNYGQQGKSWSQPITWRARRYALILIYAQNALIEGYRETLSGMEIDPSTHSLLLSMTPGDLSQLARYGNQFLEIRIDGGKFRTLAYQAKRRSQEQVLIARCIQAGASYRFLRTHFRLSVKEIAKRTQASKRRVQSRRRSATEKESDLIRKAWLSFSGRDSVSVPELFCAIHAQTRLEIPVIAAVIDDNGELKP